MKFLASSEMRCMGLECYGDGGGGAFELSSLTMKVYFLIMLQLSFSSTHLQMIARVSYLLL